MPKKKRNNRQANDKKNSALKEQTANCKKYLDLDLSSKSAGSLLKYKFLLDSLTEAIELKDNTDESSTNKLRDLYLNINKNLLNLDIENVKAKSDLKPLEKDLETAKEAFNAQKKKYDDKKKFQDLLIAKGNKVQDERNNLFDELENERKKLITDAEAYVRDLQEKLDPKNPERKKLIEENERLKKEIKKYVDEGLKMKEEFDNSLKDSGFDIKNFEEQSKMDFQKTIQSFQEKAQGGILLNTSLKTELIQIKQRNAELEKVKMMADKQYENLKNEIQNKINETVLLNTENFEIRMRMTENPNNREEVLKLLQEQQSYLKKISIMKSLNDKYRMQYDELTGEKTKKKKKKNKKNKKKKKESASTSVTGDVDDDDDDDGGHHCCCHECHSHHA